jgi:hypothetical protein
VRLFCESGAANSGEEVLHLPTIVEAAVASPDAAKAAASQIRKFLSKENYSRPHVQYNAVMLIRILADNPGPSFTKHMDKQFADTVKHLLRSGQDPSVSQILRETLDSMDREKAYDTNLGALFAMWRKEKTLMANAAKKFGPRTMNAPPWNGQQPQQQGGFGSGSGHTSSRTLPSPQELVGRIEEARTSAKLLLQLVQSTPANELLFNDLVKEFSERCMAAQRSIQGYINCDSPPPDDDTMLTLIETNEQLSLAASKHQRAVLQARRLLGPVQSPPVPPVMSNTQYAPPPQPALNTTYTPPPPQPPPRQEPSYPPPVDVSQRDNNLTPTGYEAAPANGQDQRDSPAPYNPGFQSTPSYLGRQESSGNNLTMHGAVQPTDKHDLPLPPALQAGSGRQSRSEYSTEDENPFADHHSAGFAPPSMPPPPRPAQLTEEEEYARDYPAGAGPTTPEQRRRRQDSDVSPIADRDTVTYRY